MKSHLYHLQFNINFKQNIKFYKDLFEFLGWSVIFETDAIIGFKNATNGDLWFLDSKKKEVQDYDATGLNHIAIRVSEQKDIEELIKYFETQSVDMLFGTPKHRPEFASSEEETYYQIMFKTPDNLLFEIVYIGKK